MFKWLRQALCSHEDIFDFSEPGRIKLKCMKCLRETRGFASPTTVTK